MITDAEVWDVEAVPEQDLILHRHDEINAVSESLRDVLNGRRGKQTYLFGPSGTGKTLVARYVLRTLEREGVASRHQYINCWEYHSAGGLLKRLVRRTGAMRSINHSTPHDDLLDAVADHDDLPLVLVLDEADQLDDVDLLYEFHRMDHLHLVFVANDEDEFFHKLDHRLTSRLRSGPRVRFDAYGVDELVAILRARADAGLRPHAWTDDDLRTVADLSCNDARVGIQTLYEAASLAEREGEGRLSEDLIRDAEPLAREELRRKTISNLTRRQRRVYDILDSADGWLSMGELYERYSERVDDPVVRKTVWRDLGKMERYDLVDSRGEKRGREYRTK